MWTYITVPQCHESEMLISASRRVKKQGLSDKQRLQMMLWMSGNKPWSAPQSVSITKTSVRHQPEWPTFTADRLLLHKCCTGKHHTYQVSAMRHSQKVCTTLRCYYTELTSLFTNLLPTWHSKSIQKRATFTPQRRQLFPLSYDPACGVSEQLRLLCILRFLCFSFNIEVITLHSGR